MKRFDIVIRLEDVLTGLSRFRVFAEVAEVPEVNVAEIEKDLDRRARRVADRARHDME